MEEISQNGSNTKNLKMMYNLPLAVGTDFSGKTGEIQIVLVYVYYTNGKFLVLIIVLLSCKVLTLREAG